MRARPRGPAFRSGTRSSSVLVRKLDQQRLAERVARIGQQRVADLLDRRIDRLDDRNAAEQRLPEADEPRAEEVRGDDAGQRAESRNSAARRSPGCGSRAARRAAPLSGNSSSVWSSVVTRKCSTQIVMPSGTQTSSPAIEIALHGTTRRASLTTASTPADCLAAQARSLGFGGGRVGLGRRRRRRVVLVSPRGLRLAGRGFRLGAAAACCRCEVRLVPAAALQLEAGRRDELGQRVACRTAGQSTSGASLNFCSASSSCRHAVQRYS